jgi:MtrB/PioB family decaheme-associated outer membrane protein
MKTGEGIFAVRAGLLAVRGALLAMCVAPLAAVAQDADLKAVINPTNTVEVGVIGVSKDSSKFGEYNGLNDSGGYLLGNFDVRGGNGYGLGDGTTRWQLNGTDLGTTSRSLGVSVSDQGHWELGIGFDQLRHYTTGGTYQTPYQGSMGGNTFTLPSTFGTINTGGAGTRALASNQTPAFQTQDVYTERKNANLTAGYLFNDQWNVKFAYNRLDQSGAKLIGSGTDNFTVAQGAPGGIAFGAERIAILMNPTNYQTDTVNASLNRVGKKGNLSLSYYGSIFHDAYNGLTFSNPWSNSQATGLPVPGGAAFPLDTMSTAPSNQFHQLSLTGGYRVGPVTRLAGGLSYARNTQDESFAGTYTTTPNTVPGLPVSSLGGLVVNTHADLKLTHQATNALGLSAGFKYNERDNRTASNTYTFLDLGGASRTAVTTPMSNKNYQLELAGDYRIDAKQRLHAGYEYNNVKRWCDDPLANNAQGVTPSYYTGPASCAQVPQSKENNLSLIYKLKATDTADLSAGYTHSDRKADVNSSFYSPNQAINQGYENYGWLAYYQASRKENLFKASVNWQATQQFNLGLKGRYAKDDYDPTLGVQTGKMSSISLDAAYNISENNIVAAYATWQDRSRDLLTGQGRVLVAPGPTNLWTNNLKDTDNTIGINGKQGGLLGGRLDLAEDVSYSTSKSRYSTALLYVNPAVGVQGDTPDIKSDITQVRLSGTYHANKAADVIMGYTFQRLKSDDYYYYAYQYGYTPTTLLPTNQQAPNYSVNVIYAAYRYKFQ